MDVWPAKDGWIFLHSGRLLASAEDVAQCGEGVGILLSPVRDNAWHTAGDSWSALSSRISTARVKLASAGLRQAAARSVDVLFIFSLQ